MNEKSSLISSLHHPQERNIRQEKQQKQQPYRDSLPLSTLTNSDDTKSSNKPEGTVGHC